MIDKKIKICLLAMIMMLGVSAIAEEEPSMVSEATVQAEENELIKANKETFEKAQEAINKKDYQSAIFHQNLKSMRHINYVEKRFMLCVNINWHQWIFKLQLS